MYKIEKSELPKHGKGRPLSYPWDKMNVKDSFEVECDDFLVEKKRQALLRASRSYAFNHNSTMLFTTRRTEKGIKIWRIK